MEEIASTEKLHAKVGDASHTEKHSTIAVVIGEIPNQHTHTQREHVRTLILFESLSVSSSLSHVILI